MHLVDGHDNAPGGESEVLYVQQLVLKPGVTLDLAGCVVYFETITPQDPYAPESGVTVTDSTGGGGLAAVIPAQMPMWEPGNVRKNRYISIVPNNGESIVAFSVEMTDGPGETGMLGWVGEPYDGGCLNDDGTSTGLPCTNDFVARVVADPVFRVWAEDLVHVGDCEIVPLAMYRVRATADSVAFSDPLEIGTIHKPGPRFHGDIVGESTGTCFTPPQGVVNITDIQAFLFCQQDRDGAPHLTWCDVIGMGVGSPPNFFPNVSDLQMLLKGVKGLTYLESHTDNRNPADCP